MVIEPPPVTERSGVCLVLIRHGEQERIGQDGPLTARGREQAAALVAAISLTSEDMLVSSSRQRARQTAACLGPAVEVIDDLDEYRFGPDWPRGRHVRGAPRHTVLVRVGDVSHLEAELVTGR